VGFDEGRCRHTQTDRQTHTQTQTRTRTQTQTHTTHAFDEALSRFAIIFIQIAPATAISGTIVIRRSVSCHPSMNATMKPPMKVALPMSPTPGHPQHQQHQEPTTSKCIGTGKGNRHRHRQHTHELTPRGRRAVREGATPTNSTNNPDGHPWQQAVTAYIDRTARPSFAPNPSFRARVSLVTQQHSNQQSSKDTECECGSTNAHPLRMGHVLCHLGNKLFRRMCIIPSDVLAQKGREVSIANGSCLALRLQPVSTTDSEEQAPAPTKTQATHSLQW